MTAAKVRSIRLRLGLTQEALARRLGVARATVTRWENGSRRPRRITDLAFRTTVEAKELRVWNELSGAALNALWDNPEDAIYDQWRAHYRRHAR